MKDLITDDDYQGNNTNDIKLDSDSNKQNDKTLTNPKNNEKLLKIKLLQEKIDNENTQINEFDNQIEQLKNEEKIKFKKDKKSVIEKESKKKTNKVISKLQSKSNSLYISLSNLNDKLKSLELGSSYSIQEENRSKDKLKNIKIEKEIIQNKIKEIDNQIKIIMDNENKVKPNNKKNLQKRYTSNIEEKNIINNKIPLSQIKTSPSAFLKSMEELEKKEEEQKEAKRLEKFKILRNRELEIVKRRKDKIVNLINVKTPKYIMKKDYTTADEKEEKRLREEEALVQKEIKKRKMRLQPISSQELNKFSKEVQRNEKIFMEEQDMKKMQMRQLWQERKNLLPEYKSKFYEYNKQNEDKKKEELILRKEKTKQEVRERIKYGEDISKYFQPQLNNKLKNKREQNIKKIEGIDKYNDIKELGNKLKKLSNKIALSQPKNFKLSNKFIIEKADGKRKIKKLVPLDNYKDYLTEERIKNEKKNMLTPNTKSYEKLNKWENMLNSDKNVYNNINQVKLEAELLQNKADAKKQLLKQEKGTGNGTRVDDLNNEISNLYIGSIQAKLQILKKIRNQEL